MFRVTGKPVSHCDGVSRREFLTAGSCGILGLTLADLLRAESAAGVSSSTKAVINVHLDGGPPHLDMIDLKPEAPTEIRGEFQAVSTAIPGFQMCELMPRIAANANQYVFVRSLTGSAGAHDAFQCQSGYPQKDLEPIGGRPALGCVVTKLKGTPSDSAPAYVDLMQGRPLVRNSARPGFLGPAFQAFRPDISHLFERQLEEGMKGELARRGTNHMTQLALNTELDADRLNGRQLLNTSLDRFRREIDASGMMAALDRFGQQAFGILTSGRFADALDFSKEDPRVLAKYSPDMPTDGKRFYTAEGPNAIRKFLLARRMVEAGVRCVSISISDFDTHSDNFPRMRNLLPIVDYGLNTLLEDLRDRGMLNDVVVVAWGEFGRTPRIDPSTGGRHHWPQVGPALLAGGGLETGRVLGKTDRTGSAVVSQPISYKDIMATLYRCLGIDARQLTILDPQGRPQYILDSGTPI